MDARAEPLSGEKRMLMVLFSDLVGSTALSMSLDPEDYAEVVLTYQETGRRIVADHGGSIANYLGDGLLAQFGYPIAHEDDPDRAVRAGMAIRHAVQELDNRFRFSSTELTVRVAIHAGVSIVGRMGAEERGDLALFGDTANISARVQAAGKPGQILITEEVAARLRHEFALTDLGGLSLRDINRPVRVYAVVGEPEARTRFSSTPMIGRDEHLRALQKHLEASRRGAGRGVVIRGPAGVGKSRLLTALSEDVDPSHWLEVGGSELASDSAFAITTQLVAQALDACLSKDRSARAEKLERFVAEHPLPDVSSAPLVAAMTGESSATQQSSEAAFRAVVELALHVVLTTVDRLGRAVIVVEDLHWVDPSSRAFVSRLIGKADDLPLLVVLTERPDTKSREESIEGLTNLVALEPLADDHVRRLVKQSALGAVEEALVDEIVQRAEGIPLFAEELARAAVQRSTTQLPYTLQASLLAQLDRTPDLKDVARLASALGTHIPWDVISAASGSDLEQTERSLDRLVMTGVLVRGPGARAHSFRHSLIRDAIYASLLRPDRRRAHRAVAAGLDRLGVSVDRPAELLAYHLAEGGELLDAAKWFAVAGLAAARNGAGEECQVLCRRGRDLIRDWPDRFLAAPVELQLTMTLGNATNAVEGYAAAGQLELWKRAEELSIVADDRMERSSAMNGQAVYHMLTGDAPGAVRESQRIIELGEQHGDRVALLRGHSTLAMQALFLGDMTTALASAEKGIDLYREGDYRKGDYRKGDYFAVTYGFGTDHGVILRTTAAVAHTLCGSRRASAANTEEALLLARRLDSPISLCLALVMGGMSLLLWDDTGGARSLLDEAGAVAGRYSLPFYDHTARLFSAGALALDGHPTALELALPAASALLEAGGGVGTSAGWWATALAQEAAGHPELARATAEAALEATSASEERILDAELHRVAVRASLAGGQLTQSAAAVRLSSVSDGAAGQGMFLLALRAQRDVVALNDRSSAVERLLELEGRVESGLPRP